MSLTAWNIPHDTGVSLAFFKRNRRKIKSNEFTSSFSRRISLYLGHINAHYSKEYTTIRLKEMY